MTSQAAALRGRILSAMARIVALEGEPHAYPPKALQDLLCIDWSEDPAAVVAAAIDAAKTRKPAATIEPTGRGGVNITPPEGEADRADVMAVFQHWQAATAHERCKPDAGRLGHIRARLRDGFTPAELMDAITALASSDWHNGGNDRGARYNDIRHALKDAVTVQRWLDERPAGGDPHQWAKALEATTRRGQ